MSELTYRFGLGLGTDDLETLLGTVVHTAIAHRTIRDRARDLRAEALAEGDMETYRAAASTAVTHACIMASIGQIIARTIAERTRHERVVAAINAKNRRAWFMGPACSDYTCDECDRPWWHHIATDDLGILCPFGRLFWTHARAILENTNDGQTWDGREILEVIARR